MAANALTDVRYAWELVFAPAIEKASSAMSAWRLARTCSMVSLMKRFLPGSSASGTLTIRIVDDQPSANADTNSVNEGFTTAPTTTSGNVFAAGSAGDAADQDRHEDRRQDRHEGRCEGRDQDRRQEGSR